MVEFTRLPAMVRCRAAMGVVDALGAVTGSVDASNPDRVVVQFPVSGLGDHAAVADNAVRSFRDGGFHPLTMNVNDRTAHFTLRYAA